jgi:hypothetical protein
MLKMPPAHAVPAWHATLADESDVTRQQIEPPEQSAVSSQPSERPEQDVPIESHASVTPWAPCVAQQKLDGTSHGALSHVTSPGVHGEPPSGTTQPPSGVPVSLAASAPPSRVEASVELSATEPSRVEDSGCAVASVPVSG